MKHGQMNSGSGGVIQSQGKTSAPGVSAKNGYPEAKMKSVGNVVGTKLPNGGAVKGKGKKY